jgi:hypothetical protein
VCWEKHCRERYIFRFTCPKQDGSSAEKLAEGYLFGMSLLEGPMVKQDHGSLVFRVPKEIMLDFKSSIALEDLVRLEESRLYQGRIVDKLKTIGTTTPDIMEEAWKIAGLTFTDFSLFKAARYFSRSTDFFYISPGQINDVIATPALSPTTGSDQSRYEDALQNAFKAVEAVIGDLPKDDRRLFIKLKNIGLVPDELVGYRDKKPLYQTLRDMNKSRDKRSAHGSTPEGKITTFEMMNYQMCADCIIKSALYNRLKGKGNK